MAVRGALLAVFCTLPWLAHAQAWSVLGEVPVDFSFRTVFDDGHPPRTVNLTDPGGLMLSVGTPYHVGFGLEGYKGNIAPQPGASIKLTVYMLDAYVDVPVPWIALHVGTGWGQLSFDPDRTQDSSSTSKLDTINLWQWFVRLGVPLPWSLHLFAGYREAHGSFNITHSSGKIDSRPSAIIVSSLGLSYTF